MGLAGALGGAVGLGAALVEDEAAAAVALEEDVTFEVTSVLDDEGEDEDVMGDDVFLTPGRVTPVALGGTLTEALAFEDDGNDEEVDLAAVADLGDGVGFVEDAPTALAVAATGFAAAGLAIVVLALLTLTTVFAMFGSVLSAEEGPEPVALGGLRFKLTSSPTAFAAPFPAFL